MKPGEYRELLRRVERLEAIVGTPPPKPPPLSESKSAAAAPEAVPSPPSAGEPAPEHGAIPPPLPRTGSAPLESPDVPDARGAEVWLGRIGAGVFVIGLLFFLKLSFDRGWISAAVQMAAVAIVSIGLLVFGNRRRNDAAGAVLFATGIAGLFGTVLASHLLYHLFPATAALLLASLVSLLCLVQAARTASQALAVLSVGGGYLALVLFSDAIAAPGLPVAFASVILACAAVLHLLRGWNAVLLAAVAGNWPVLVWTASNMPQAAVFTQSGILWGWFCLHGAVLARQIRDKDSAPAGRALFVVASCLAPLFAVGTSSLLWEAMDSHRTGLAFLAVAAFCAVMGVVVTRSSKDIAAPQFFSAVLSLLIAVALLTDGVTLVLSFAAVCLALHLSWGMTGSPVAMFGAVVALGVLSVSLLMEMMGWSREFSIMSLVAVASGIAAIFAGGILSRSEEASLGLRFFGYGLAALAVGFWADAEGAGVSLLAALWSLLALLLFNGVPGGAHRVFPVVGSLAYAAASTVLMVSLASATRALGWDNTAFVPSLLAVLVAAGFYVSKARGAEQARQLTLWIGGATVLTVAYHVLAPVWNGVFVSPVWAVFAAALMVCGVRWRNAPAKAGAIGVLILMLVRLFFVDLAGLDAVWRTGVFVFVGALLLGIGTVLSARK